MCYGLRRSYTPYRRTNMTVVTRPSPPPLTGTRWKIDAQASSVEFGVRRLPGLSTVHGRFARFDGELELPADGAGRAELVMEAASVETRNRRRDRHLRSADYFDCDRHPLVRFSGTAVADAKHLDVVGELHAAGRSTELEMRAPVQVVDGRLHVAARTVVDARELGMSWSPVGKLRTPATLSVHACLRRVS
jgi:polyisoprenoid-binding protein YceI